MMQILTVQLATDTAVIADSEPIPLFFRIAKLFLLIRSIPVATEFLACYLLHIAATVAANVTRYRNEKMTTTIKTNNVRRPILHAWELSLAELADFDYLIDAPEGATEEELQALWMECDSSFFRYKGQLYDIGEFIRIERQSQRTNSFCCGVDDDSPLLAWDGIQTDSHFSAIVIRYPRDEYGMDDENIIVGLALS